MAGWSELNGDLLLTITMAKSTTLEDYIRLQAVCKSWRFFLKQTLSFCGHRQLPWLVLPYDDDEDIKDKASCDRHGFYSLSDKRVHHLQLPEAKPSQKRCIGSSYGWLAMVDWTSPSISLLNPLTRSQIQLPPFTTFPDILEFCPHKSGEEYLCQWLPDGEKYTFSAIDIPDFYIYKIVLSSDRRRKKDETIAMAICGELRHLAFCRVGGQEEKSTRAWIPLQCYQGLADLVYWRDHFYAVNFSGGLVFCDLDSSSTLPVVNVVFECPSAGAQIDPCAHKYLAVDPVSRELLMILRNGKTLTTEEDDGDDYYGGGDDEYYSYDEEDGEVEEKFYFYRTTKFEVYRLVEEKVEWEKVRGIGNNKVLFLGCNSSMCLRTDDFDECTIRGNCIYFTEEREGYSRADHRRDFTQGKYEKHDLGIFDLEEGTFETLPCCPDPYSPTLFWSPPIWVTPSLPN